MNVDDRLNVVDTRKAEGSTRAGGMSCLLALIGDRTVVVRGDRRSDIASDAFAFAEEREEDQRGDEQNLQNDGCDEGSALDFASTLLEFGITFDEATTKETRLVLRTGALDHYTPPKIPLRGVGFGGADFSEVVFGKPAPLSQGCEVRASSAPFDT